jgi:putative transposase
VNPKRVYRLLREYNLLCVRKRKFVVTTDSNHGRKVYPNLAAEMVLSGMDQLWRADLTYIRLREEFVFLAVILDAFSRRVIGWALDRNMEDELTLRALRMALSQRNLPPGLLHHSDRGSQYASNEYTELPEAHGIQISMSRKGNPSLRSSRGTRCAEPLRTSAFSCAEYGGRCSGVRSLTPCWFRGTN